MTRWKIVQTWLAAVLLIAVAATAWGVAVTVGTAVLLLAMCLVPAAIVLMLWPADRVGTTTQAIRDAKTR